MFFQENASENVVGKGNHFAHPILQPSSLLPGLSRAVVQQHISGFNGN